MTQNTVPASDTPDVVESFSYSRFGARVFQSGTDKLIAHAQECGRCLTSMPCGSAMDIAATRVVKTTSTFLGLQLGG